MTTDAKVTNAEEVSRATRLESGRAQISGDLGGWDAYQQVVKRTGIYGLSAFVEDVLNANYPTAIFGDGTNLYPSWASEHGGADIEPGVKWVSLLRQAVREVEP